MSYRVDTISAPIPVFTVSKMVEIRKAGKLTHGDMATLLGVSRSTYIRLEKSSEELSVAQCLMLSHIKKYSSEL